MTAGKENGTDPVAAINEITHLVFEGGGGKGIAYLGALAALTDIPPQKVYSPQPGLFKFEKTARGIDDCVLNTEQIDGVAGSSVGSLIALLLSSGYGLHEIYLIVKNQEVMLNFAASDHEYPTSRYVPDLTEPTGFSETTTEKTARQKIASAIDEFGLPISVRSLADWAENAKKSITETVADVVDSARTFTIGVTWGEVFLRMLGVGRRETYLDNLNAGYGLASGRYLHALVDQIAKGELDPSTGIPTPATLTPSRDRMTFQQHRAKHGVELVATGAEITRGRVKYFSARNGDTPHLSVADAIRTSTAFPGVFMPTKVTKNTLGVKKGVYVDGGVLNNFPILAFSNRGKQNSVRSLGLRLEVDTAREIDSVQDVLLGTVESWFEHSTESQIQSAGDAARAIDIEVSDLSTLRFGVSESELDDALIEAALSVYEHFGYERDGKIGKQLVSARAKQIVDERLKKKRVAPAPQYSRGTRETAFSQEMIRRIVEYTNSSETPGPHPLCFLVHPDVKINGRYRWRSGVALTNDHHRILIYSVTNQPKVEDIVESILEDEARARRKKRADLPSAEDILLAITPPDSAGEIDVRIDFEKIRDYIQQLRNAGSHAEAVPLQSVVGRYVIVVKSVSNEARVRSIIDRILEAEADNRGISRGQLPSAESYLQDIDPPDEVAEIHVTFDHSTVQSFVNELKATKPKGRSPASYRLNASGYESRIAGIQAGHLFARSFVGENPSIPSRFRVGEPERFAVQLAGDNWMQGAREAKGAREFLNAIDIEGVPVEVESARAMESDDDLPAVLTKEQAEDALMADSHRITVHSFRDRSATEAAIDGILARDARERGLERDDLSHAEFHVESINPPEFAAEIDVVFSEDEVQKWVEKLISVGADAEYGPLWKGEVLHDEDWKLMPGCERDGLECRSLPAPDNDNKFSSYVDEKINTQGYHPGWVYKYPQ